VIWSRQLQPTTAAAQAAFTPATTEPPMSFALYLLGFVLLTGGIAWALVTAGVPYLYVAIACVILVGLGIITGVSKTRSKDVSK
jgi:hypothetical protein